MKILGQRDVQDCSVTNGHFNRGEHTFLELEPGKYQTISVQLPTGKFVTLAFVPSHKDPNDFECMDIHSTTGPRVARNDVDNPEQYGYLHHMIGFTVGRNTFTTRDQGETKRLPTTLATLLLQSGHYDNQESREQAQRLTENRKKKVAA